MSEVLAAQCDILREGLEAIRNRVSRRLDPAIWHTADNALRKAALAAPMEGGQGARNGYFGGSGSLKSFSGVSGPENGEGEA